MYELTGAKKQYANIIKIDDLIRRGTYPSVEQLAEEATTVAKTSRPSVIEKLRAPLPAQTAVKPKSRELEV